MAGSLSLVLVAEKGGEGDSFGGVRGRAVLVVVVDMVGFFVVWSGMDGWSGGQGRGLKGRRGVWV